MTNENDEVKDEEFTDDEEGSEEEQEEVEEDDDQEDSEGDEDEETDDEEDDDPEDKEKDAKKKRKESQIDRLKKANKKLRTQLKERESGSNEDMDTIRLEARGILDAEEQKIVKRAAKAFGVSVVDALNDELVQGQLDKHKLKVKNNAAGVRPKGRKGSSSSDNMDTLIEKAAKGEYPKDKEQNKKVREEMARRAEHRH